MAQEIPDGAPEPMSVQDMKDWLTQEARDTEKARELRLREAHQLVNDYAAGKLDSDQAWERLQAYDRRWGDALFGAHSVPGQSDEAVLATIDKARDESFGNFTDRYGREAKGKSETPPR